MKVTGREGGMHILESSGARGKQFSRKVGSVLGQVSKGLCLCKSLSKNRDNSSRLGLSPTVISLPRLLLYLRRCYFCFIISLPPPLHLTPSTVTFREWARAGRDPRRGVNLGLSSPLGFCCHCREGIQRPWSILGILSLSAWAGGPADGDPGRGARER